MTKKQIRTRDDSAIESTIALSSPKPKRDSSGKFVSKRKTDSSVYKHPVKTKTKPKAKPPKQEDKPPVLDAGHKPALSARKLARFILDPANGVRDNASIYIECPVYSQNAKGELTYLWSTFKEAKSFDTGANRQIVTLKGDRDDQKGN